MASDECEPDAFDAIVMAETRFHGEGYQEGYVEGKHAGVVEGRQYGMQQGANIGLEIGSYLGFAMTWQRLLLKGSNEKHRFVRYCIFHLILDLVLKDLHLHSEKQHEWRKELQ
ncbi:protein LTO1 homolog isoform X3 [Rhineura floridana]|uniref:protein LTO1 homolog isoform X3 n=1 Tax=Rhineura floridana TaxID=261503 RepID=UPI002AC876FF|nr:protein LTO1 homolog isoform X3 [Rhineura floridana]